MMIGPITSVAALLSLQVLYVLPAAYTFPQSIDNVATSEICRFVDAGSLQMQEVKNDKETFREHEEYINEWVINIIEGSDVADEIAEKHGFLNVGLISPAKEDQGVGLYKFVLKEEEVFLMPRYAPYQKKIQLLTTEENVLSAQQKTVHIQCSKTNGKHTGRERRQSRATNLRATWLTPSRVNVSWDHPDPPPDSYRLIHAAIDISNGAVTTLYRFFPLPATQQSIVLTGASQDDINIFHLNAVYGDTIFSAIFLNGQATLPAPANPAIETLDCSRLQASWEPPPAVGTYTYAVVAYNGSSITFHNVGSATSEIVDNRAHLSTYIVFLVAVSGNDYGALFEIFTLESVRLVDGVRSCEGRVEVYRGGQWGTVCDELWGIDEANVVCSQMNCGNAISSPSPRLGVGTGPILMTNVQCRPGDSCIEHCPHSNSTTGCTQSQDVSVTCGDPPTDPPTAPTSPTTPPTVPVSCPPVASIDNGQVVSTGFVPGETLTYSCYEGFELVGNPVRTCLANGEWSGQGPVCNPCPSSGCTPVPVCNDWDIRLVGGSETEGRVEVCYNNRWGTVCDDLWGTDDARVVCRQLNLNDSAPIAFRSARHGQGEGPILLDNVACTGSEISLQQCPNNGVGNHNCGHHEDAGVSCPVPCENWDVRLVGGSKTEGRVEVCYGNQWRTVCDDLWDSNDAKVVCSQLGLRSSSPTAYPRARHGQGEGPILLDNVVCTGSETSLQQCRHNGVGNHNCGHSEDAGVACSNVRLVNGQHTCEGRVEVYHNDQWGTVCDDFWSITDANVVCAQVDCGPARQAPRRARFGQGTGPIWMDDVQCTASDSTLEECTHSEETSDCSHSEDASVICEDLCSQLSDPENGTVTVIDSTATYTCDSGHQLSGDQTRTCENGVWSGEQPTCPLIACEISGQVYMECGTACPAVCGEENVDICTLQCVSGCQCPLGTILDRKSAQCVTECPLPNPPVNVRLSQENSSSLRVQWEHSCDGPPTTHYLINYISFESDFTLITNQSIIVHKSSILAIIVNLHNIPAGSIHTVIVIAVHGRISVSSKPTHLHIFIPTVPPVLCNCPPTINELKQVSLNSLGLTWSHPCCVPPTTHYIITVVHVSTRSIIVQRPLYITVFPSVTSWVFTDLNLGAGNIYIFVVTAVSGHVSFSSSPVNFTISNTLGIDPPTNVNVVSLTSSARVSWTAPQLADVSNYYIFYAPVAVNGGRTLREYVSSRDISDTLRGLNDGVTYVAVVIDRGSTPSASEPVMFTI